MGVAPRVGEKGWAGLAKQIARAFPVLAILLVAVAVQLVALHAGSISWGSDQALVAIMAHDILERGDHPVFYYGSAYAGTVEPHWMAVVFGLCGVSVGAYRAAVMALLACLLYVVYRTARERFDRPVALLAMAYLAVPPFFFLYKGLTSDGSYDSVTLLGSCVLLAALRLEDALRRGRPALGWVAALGGAAGMGWWVNPMIAAFYLAVAVWVFWVRPPGWARPLHLAVFAATFFLGGLPWWLSNLRHSWHSLGEGMAVPDGVPDVLEQLFGNFWTLGLPILLGSRPVGQLQASYPGETLAAALLYLVPAAVAACFVWQRRRGLCTDPTDEEASRGARCPCCSC